MFSANMLRIHLPVGRANVKRLSAPYHDACLRTASAACRIGGFRPRLKGGGGTIGNFLFLSALGESVPMRILKAQRHETPVQLAGVVVIPQPQFTRRGRLVASDQGGVTAFVKDLRQASIPAVELACSLSV